MLTNQCVSPSGSFQTKFCLKQFPLWGVCFIRDGIQGWTGWVECNLEAHPCVASCGVSGCRDRGTYDAVVPSLPVQLWQQKQLHVKQNPGRRLRKWTTSARVKFPNKMAHNKVSFDVVFYFFGHLCSISPMQSHLLHQLDPPSEVLHCWQLK